MKNLSGDSDAHTFAPVGRCIYCRAETYAPDSDRPLAEEHIIPYALNGNLVLPRASCRRCERIINKFETRILRGLLLGFRTFAKMQSRNPKDRDPELPLYDTDSKRIMVKAEDYPIGLILPVYGAPLILSGKDTISMGFWTNFLRVDARKLQRRYGLTTWSPPRLDNEDFFRLLAKIAHAHAVAVWGLDGFDPVLPEAILDEAGPEVDARWRWKYIGGSMSEWPTVPVLHEIQADSLVMHDDSRLAVVTLRLFGQFGAPVYRVVAGRLPPHPEPPEAPPA